MKNMKILAIETSCDETAIALVEAKGGLRNPQFKILKNFVASQIKIHAPFGGVVPNLAKREHLKNLPILLKRIMNHELKIKNKKTIIHNSKFIIPDVIAVTVGPGLEPALWTGIGFAKELCKKLKVKNEKLKVKLQGVSHLDGHLYSFFLNQKNKITNYFPAIALIISGGHTILVKMDSLTKIKKIGETRDDAVGEAFDKVARLLNLPYPGGPEIEKLAKLGNPDAIKFPRPMLDQKNFDFSFSGLKTSVLYYIRDSKLRIYHNTLNENLGHSDKFVVSDRLRADIAASFQRAAFDVLIKKTLRAAEQYKAKSIMISGGVASNNSLRNYFKLKVKSEKLKVNFFAPSKKFTTDNAAMIAVAAYVNHLRKKKYKLVANGNLNIG
ncbi:MAG: tRNA (adenosine(37)-N6)-threonylcarbamoyltransferase complex transferase subunit TsaD [Patescibacteria group bacterium]